MTLTATTISRKVAVDGWPKLIVSVGVGAGVLVMGIGALAKGGPGEGTGVKDTAFDSALSSQGITASADLISEAHAKCSMLAGGEPALLPAITEPTARARATAIDTVAVAVYCPSRLSTLLALPNRN